MSEAYLPPRADSRSLDMLCHLLGLALLTGIPFANVFAPLILWVWKRKTYPSVDLHGKEALNFQISMSLYSIIASLPMLVFVIFIPLPLLVLLPQLILTIVAAVQASKGNFYRYPLTIRLLN